MLIVKPVDIAVLLKVIAVDSEFTTAHLAEEMRLSPAEVYASFQRTSLARLFDNSRKVVKIPALEEFLFHGIQYVFPSSGMAVTRGMPTSIAAPPLVFTHFDEPDIPPIWPHPMGTKRGYILEPLYRRAAVAAAADTRFYELLALTDAIREGKPRVKNIAIIELQKRFKAYSAKIASAKE